MRAFAILLISFLASACFGAPKEDLLRAILPGQITLIVTNKSDIANRKIILRDFTTATYGYLPVFTSPENLTIFLKEQPEVRKEGDQMIFMDRALFAEILRGHETIMIDPGTDFEVKTTAALMKSSLSKKGPNQSLEPTTMSVTPPATQEPRQP